MFTSLTKMVFVYGHYLHVGCISNKTYMRFSYTKHNYKVPCVSQLLNKVDTRVQPINSPSNFSLSQFF